jgi:hypothetical protein
MPLKETSYPTDKHTITRLRRDRNNYLQLSFPPISAFAGALKTRAPSCNRLIINNQMHGQFGIDWGFGPAQALLPCVAKGG